jgi:hypothetical protein
MTLTTDDGRLIVIMTRNERQSLAQSSIQFVNRRSSIVSRCSDRSLVPTLDIVGAIARVVGYHGDTIF